MSQSAPPPAAPGGPGPSEVEARRVAAERFIEASQDGAAIRALAEIRRDRAGYLERLGRFAARQPTLRIAFGVCLGLIAAEAVVAVLRSDTLRQLLVDLDAQIERLGGLDRLATNATLPDDGPANSGLEARSAIAREATADTRATTGACDDEITALADHDHNPDSDLDLDLDLDLDDV